MEIFTDIDFIAEGNIFPPIQSRERIENYRLNLSRYKGNYNKDKVIKVKTANGVKSLRWEVPEINYYKLITDKLVGLIFNEKPVVSCRIGEVNNIIQDLIQDTYFWYYCGESVRTFSSLGDGVLYVYYDGNRARVNAINPQFWFKVVSDVNINEVKCHVLTQPIYKVDFTGVKPEDKPIALRVLYHYRGYYIERYFEYNGTRIGNAIEYINDRGEEIGIEGKRVETGLRDFSVFDFSNNKAIDEVYGISDYKVVEDIISLKEKKVSQLDVVTDKHFDPIVQVPITSIEENEETGEPEFNGFGNWIAVRGDEEIKYISWDAKTSAVEDLISILDDEIAKLSEMGKAFLHGEYANVSGEALKTMIKSALDKASRCIDIIEPSVKKTLCAMLELEGYKIEPSDLTIRWQDGITESDNVIAQTARTKIESGLMSRKRAMIVYEGLTEEEADEELKLIEGNKEEDNNA